MKRRAVPIDLISFFFFCFWGFFLGFNVPFFSIFVHNSTRTKTYGRGWTTQWAGDANRFGQKSSPDCIARTSLSLSLSLDIVVVVVVVVVVDHHLLDDDTAMESKNVVVFESSRLLFLAVATTAMRRDVFFFKEPANGSASNEAHPEVFKSFTTGNRKRTGLFFFSFFF